jgi:hypothetical protein
MAKNVEKLIFGGLHELLSFKGLIIFTIIRIIDEFRFCLKKKKNASKVLVGNHFTCWLWR